MQGLLERFDEIIRVVRFIGIARMIVATRLGREI
jgi:hypothetical protein